MALNVILGRARRSAAKPECPDALRQELVTIAEQSERISRVVASLLSVARPSKGAESVSDAKRVIDNVVTFLGSECRHRGIHVEVDGGAGSAPLAIEPDQFFQVLLNLCVNAIEAQPEGGRLAIRLRRDEAGGSRRAVLEVEDGGPGVPADIASRIFEPFFTTKADRSGSGLGLDIASGIVRDAGGALELTSSEGGGARFRLTLPLAVKRAPDRARERVA
jgi:signal transduction histidine kinase